METLNQIGPFTLGWLMSLIALAYVWVRDKWEEHKERKNYIREREILRQERISFLERQRKRWTGRNDPSPLKIGNVEMIGTKLYINL